MCSVKGTVHSISYCSSLPRNRMDGQLPGDMSAARSTFILEDLQLHSGIKVITTLKITLVRFSLEHGTRSEDLENLRVIPLLLWVVLSEVPM